MEEQNKNKMEQLEQGDLETKKTEVATDWAECASQELADYIEEQGIQIRY